MREDVAPDPEIRPSAAAKLLGVNQTTVRLWIREGLLPARKTRPDGGHYRLRRADVEALRQRQQFKPDARVLKRQTQEEQQAPT
jgi:excisionase family DNA binding protein